MAKRNRRDKQKLQIEGQTIQWPQDTDEINRSYKSKVRQYNGQTIPTRYTEVTNRRSDYTMATRYRRDKQKVQIESQTIQWPRDTDEINRSYKTKVRQYNGQTIPTRYTEVTNRRSDYTMATRYRRDKQKVQIEGQTIQWPRDTDEINRSYKSKVRQYNGIKIPTR
jgi:Zn/Cd-binding protein ZinT